MLAFIAKTNHYAAIVDYFTGEVILIPFHITNYLTSFDLLFSKISNFSKENTLIVLESSALYENNLIFLFSSKGL